MDTLFLHIGLPKTATTFLQREVFPALSHIRYLGMPQGGPFTLSEDYGHGQRALTSCMTRSVAVWPAYGDRVLEGVLGHQREERPGGSVLLSDEGVGRAGSRPILLNAHLRGLADVARTWGFGRVAVVCAVRRQDQWLASHFAQVSDRNGHPSQSGFADFVRQTVDPTGGRYQFGMLLDYAVLVDHLRDAVGDQNVLVLPHEKLVETPDAFFDRLAEFLGEEVGVRGSRSARQNVRSEGGGVWGLRPSLDVRSVRLRPRRVFSALGLPEEVRLVRRTSGHTIHLTESLSALVLRTYRESNDALAKTGVELEPYGYFG